MSLISNDVLKYWNLLPKKEWASIFVASVLGPVEERKKVATSEERPPVKLVIGFIYKDDDDYRKTLQILQKKFGEVDFCHRLPARSAGRGFQDDLGGIKFCAHNEFGWGRPTIAFGDDKNMGIQAGSILGLDGCADGQGCFGLNIACGCQIIEIELGPGVRG